MSYGLASFLLTTYLAIAVHSHHHSSHKTQQSIVQCKDVANYQTNGATCEKNEECINGICCPVEDGDKKACFDLKPIDLNVDNDLDEYNNEIIQQPEWVKVKEVDYLEDRTNGEDPDMDIDAKIRKNKKLDIEAEVTKNKQKENKKNDDKNLPPKTKSPSHTSHHHGSSKTRDKNGENVKKQEFIGTKFFSR